MLLDGHLDSVFDYMVEPLCSTISCQAVESGKMVNNSSFQKSSRYTQWISISILNGFPWRLKTDDRNETTESIVTV